MYMTLSDLQNYKKWVNQSPEVILHWVKFYNGWKVVFPKVLPPEVHQVRNYFNQEPTTLTRYAKDFADVFLADRIKHARTLGSGVKERMAARGALTEYVYGDEHKRLWYQMNSGSTIYHYGMSRGSVTFENVKVKSETVEGIDASYKQGWVPVFKLMHLDGTGGSMETIIHNPMDIKRVEDVLTGPRRLNIGEVNKEEKVKDRIVTEPWYQGSYNYSETAEVGFAAHERHDIKPDNENPTALVNPPNRHMPLALRRFPKL
ncbi:MAG TPA: hypothetical protein VJ890_20990 [Vineibacter sp.]|nr:hypothetical protein [Vineibacter sp.]